MTSNFEMYDNLGLMLGLYWFDTSGFFKRTLPTCHLGNNRDNLLYRYKDNNCSRYILLQPYKYIPYGKVTLRDRTLSLTYCYDTRVSNNFNLAKIAETIIFKNIPEEIVRTSVRLYYFRELVCTSVRFYYFRDDNSE